MGTLTFLATPQSLTPTSGASWVDVDCTSYVASGATGVLLFFKNTSSTTAYNFGVGPAASERSGTWNTDTIRATAGTWAVAKLDSNQDFGCRRGDDAITITLVGYFDSGAVFFTQCDNKSTTIAG